MPFELSNTHVYVQVCAGARRLDFLLDTGAGQTFFDLNTAKRLGIELGAPFTASGSGPGTVAGAALPNSPVTLAGTTIAVPVSRAIDFSGLTPREGRVVEGVLGYDFIAGFVVAIDYVGGELRLYDRSSFRYQGPGVSIPVRFVNNHPHIDAEIRLADGETVRTTFLIDVGSSLPLSLTKPFVEKHQLRSRVGKTIRRPGGGGVGGPAMADYGRVPVLRLGSLELRDVVTLMFGDDAGVFSGNGSWSGNIGSDVLRRFLVVLDYGNRRMILEPHRDTTEPFETDMSGAALTGTPDLTRILVDFVVSSSSADAAGLRRGDVVVAVDGQPIGPRTLLDLRARLRREGERVALTVARGEAMTVVSLTTRRLL